MYTTDNEIKYVLLKPSTVKVFKDMKVSVTNPKPGYIVLIYYTSYLSNDQMFDTMHADKESALLLSLIHALSFVVLVM